MTNVIPGALAPTQRSATGPWTVACASSIVHQQRCLRRRQLSGVWRSRTAIRQDQGIAAEEDHDDVGAATDLPVEAFVPVTMELSKDAVEVRADGLMPLTSSQPANTSSWTRIGRKRKM